MCNEYIKVTENIAAEKQVQQIQREVQNFKNQVDINPTATRFDDLLSYAHFLSICINPTHAFYPEAASVIKDTEDFGFKTAVEIMKSANPAKYREQLKLSKKCYRYGSSRHGTKQCSVKTRASSETLLAKPVQETYISVDPDNNTQSSEKISFKDISEIHVNRCSCSYAHTPSNMRTIELACPSVISYFKQRKENLEYEVKEIESILKRNKKDVENVEKVKLFDEMFNN